jgi:bacterioferritin-associated ferredoxin
LQPDDEICLCFHVTWRKAINFARVHRVKQASQMSECFGAGTGCGWCRKQLTRIVEEMKIAAPQPNEIEAWLAARSPRREQYARGRDKYIAEGKGTPPSDPGPEGERGMRG